MISLCCYCYNKCTLSHVFSTLPYKEEEEVAKAETEEKKIIDPNGDVVSVKAAKHIIEYCIPSHYLTVSELHGKELHHKDKRVNLTVNSWYTGSLAL